MSSDIYSGFPNYVLAFHGCDEDVRNKILLGEEALRTSHNDYDWLGSGSYFWEQDHIRALEFADYVRDNPDKFNVKITKPSVLGAIIDLGLCLNLLDRKNVPLLQESHELLLSMVNKTNGVMPRNMISNGFPLLRRLDCAVINVLHLSREQNNLPQFDTVRAAFWEGDKIYEGSSFMTQSHIQICVRNQSCIKGFFKPLL